jgi:hypothetical protein
MTSCGRRADFLPCRTTFNMAGTRVSERHWSRGGDGPTITSAVGRTALRGRVRNLGPIAPDRLREEHSMDRDTSAAQNIAAFALRVGEADLAADAADRLKRSILDALGCAIGALGAEPVRRIRALEDEFGGGIGRCTLVGGGSAAPDRAALVNGCLVRYLDFMDNFAARGEVALDGIQGGGLHW